MKLRAPLLVLAAALTFAACGDDDGGSVTEANGAGSSSASASGSAAGSGSGSASAAESGECVLVGDTEAAADTVVETTLEEWAIGTSRPDAPAGVIEFRAVNEGQHGHELVIVRGAGPEELTITEAGLDEEALPEGAEVLGEIEGFPGGETCAGNFELEAGDYTLVCNIVEEEDHVVHAEKGMVAAFTVT